MSVESCLTFIVPAYIKNQEDIVLLTETIERISTISSDIILFSQGMDPNLVANVRNFHSEIKLGKWSAIARAQSFELSQYVFLHDGDNPFTARSYENFPEFTANTFINRDVILLFAKDEKSEHSRKYVELFLNKYIGSSRANVDIQSGAIILQSDLFRKLSLNRLGEYGGELFVYRHLKKLGVQINTIDMEVQKCGARRQSNYTIEAILRSLIEAPLRMKNVSHILELCTRDYREYIHDAREFKAEVVYFLKKFSLIC